MVTNVSSKFYDEVRARTVLICDDLAIEDYIPQPIVEVSPPKWHLAHTSWFFEEFILKPHFTNYKIFHEKYNFLFNSYYQTIGERVDRAQRGFLTRPTVAEIYSYRSYIDQHMRELFSHSISSKLDQLITLGLQHEQQHQELLITDIKFILGSNPLYPPVKIALQPERTHKPIQYITVESGNYPIGFAGTGFYFDNELAQHEVHVPQFEISSELVTNAEYLEFVEDKGYQRFDYWHDDGWYFITTHNIIAPAYWHKIDGEWHNYSFAGLTPLKLHEPVTHISFYEAAAFAQWQEKRLPTEFEWEIAADQFKWGSRWEWTSSAYLPYPNFVKTAGALGEYNGKFMINQMVLRGASIATSAQHSRKTYRNFFYPNARWQFTGIRLVK